MTEYFGVDKDEFPHITWDDGKSGLCGAELLRTVSYDIDADKVCSKCREIWLDKVGSVSE